MIPPFNDDGYLPPGIHGATLEEVSDRFGQGSELRRIQMESLRWLVDLARRAKVLRIVVNGSFVTDLAEPNDVDCVLLVSPDFQPDDPNNQELLAELPFISMQIVDQAGFDFFVNQFFSTDRDTTPKGMIEILP
jgi:hypothetical protein